VGKTVTEIQSSSVSALPEVEQCLSEQMALLDCHGLDADRCSADESIGLSHASHPKLLFDHHGQGLLMRGRRSLPDFSGIFQPDLRTLSAALVRIAADRSPYSPGKQISTAEGLRSSQPLKPDETAWT
jgi:hypothetical protein